MPKITMIPSRKPEHSITEAFPEDDPDRVTDANGLVCDRWGVPYADQYAARNRGTPIDKRSKEASKDAAKKFQQCSDLLAVNKSRGAIKRLLAELWDMEPRSVEKYISVATAMNRDRVGVDLDTAKSDSLAFWTADLQQQRTISRKGQEYWQKIGEQSEAVDKYIAALQALPLAETPEGIAATTRLVEKLYKVAESQENLADRVRSIQLGADEKARQVHDRIDKILGTHAPAKHEHTGDVKNSVTGAIAVVGQIQHTAEPLTREGAIADMLDVLADDAVLIEVLRKLDPDRVLRCLPVPTTGELLTVATECCGDN